METQKPMSGTQETQKPESPRLPEPAADDGAYDETNIDKTETESLVKHEPNDAEDPADGTDEIRPHAEPQNRHDSIPPENPKLTVDKRSVVEMLKRNWRLILCVSAPITVFALLVGFGIVMFLDTVLRKPTDGAWSHWGNWEECSVTCGTGIHHRSRNCSNPVPSHGGRYCAGPPLEYQMCPIQPCPDYFPAFTVFYPKEKKFIRLASWDVLFQSGSDFNASTGVFNCSVAGIYQFSVTLVKKHGPNTKVYCHMYKNDDHVNEDFMLHIRNSTEMDAVSLTAVLRLKEGDRVYLGDCTDPGSTLEKWTTFTGVLQRKE